MTGPDFTIRPFAAGEERQVIALWQASGLTRVWNNPQADLDFARGKPNSEVLVGLLKTLVVASCMVGHDGHRGAVYYVAVDAEARGMGFGRAIMQGAEDWLLDRGVWKINVMIRSGNEQVLKFYDLLGYQRSATTVVEKWIDPAKKGGS